MRFRSADRLPGTISEIGYGMWGMGGWTGSDDSESAKALDRAVELGCNFFDTAAAYGDGRSEQLLGALISRHPGHRVHVATKVPPKNRIWPARPTTPVDDVFPYEHVIACTRTSARNLGVERIDLQQLHVWDDSWTDADGWRRAVQELKREGLIAAFGLSVNRWEPRNVLRVLETGLVDSVQVVYNIFDQAPEDLLLPTCQRQGIAVIARVPFDEGSLTGALSADSHWPDGDWRNLYFAPHHLAATLPRVDALKRDAEGWGIELADLALRFILSQPAVTTTIPGMRRRHHVEANLAASDRPRLQPTVLRGLMKHRWDRLPDDRP